jgi:hypothetical protein
MALKWYCYAKVIEFDASMFADMNEDECDSAVNSAIAKAVEEAGVGAVQVQCSLPVARTRLVSTLKAPGFNPESTGFQP